LIVALELSRVLAVHNNIFLLNRIQTNSFQLAAVWLFFSVFIAILFELWKSFFLKERLSQLPLFINNLEWLYSVPI